MTLNSDNMNIHEAYLLPPSMTSPPPVVDLHAKVRESKSKEG
jgi:hypothetical protein